MNSKSNIADFSNLNLSGLVIDKNQETLIRGFAERIGNQTSLLVSDLISVIMYLILAKISSHPAKSGLSTRSSPSNGDRLLSAVEVAGFLNISKAKAYQLMQEGGIPTVRIGRTARVRQQDLDLFVRKHVIRSGS